MSDPRNMPGSMENIVGTNYNYIRMCEETNRANTFGDHDQYVLHPKVMAKAGFYELNKRLICFRCSLKIDIGDIGETDDIVEVHQKKSPDCIFARNLPSLPRSRLAVASDLRYEMKRLETFIDWPLGEEIEARDLAAAGFYYSRKKCECICFCCRTRMSFRQGAQYLHCDHHTSMSQYVIEKHLREVDCDFAQGKITGNVPICIDKIMNKIIGYQETNNEKNICDSKEGRICGASGEEPGDLHESGNHGSSRTSAENRLTDMGIERYSGPMHEKYAISKDRKYTYGEWPLRDTSLAKKLIDAGFFYTGRYTYMCLFYRLES